MPRLQEGAVKAADQLARDAAEIPGHEWRAPVPADIVEGTQDPVLAPHNQLRTV